MSGESPEKPKSNIKYAPKYERGVTPQLASILSYLPFLGIIFIVLEKDNRLIRFHAWQSTVFWISWLLLFLSLKFLAFILAKVMGLLGAVIDPPVVFLTNLALFVVWILCLVRAYQGRMWKIPYIGEFAEKKSS